MGSQDAIDIFAQDPNIRFCLNITMDETRTFQNAKLVLNRKKDYIDSPVIWELWLPERCPNVERRYFMDAASGNLLEFDH